MDTMDIMDKANAIEFVRAAKTEEGRMGNQMEEVDGERSA